MSRKNAVPSKKGAVSKSDRALEYLPFVEALARRMAATMPHNIDLDDLVQDGVIGLMDALERFDESHGVKFETFAERRIRGAMIDALRKDAWPRGVRRMRRELEAAREKLRATLGHEPSLADLAEATDTDVKRLGRTVVRINTIESTSPFSSADEVDSGLLPAVLAPPKPESPYEVCETRDVAKRVRAAIQTLPPRERKLVVLYYYREVTMKQIGEQLWVNESRISQLHDRAVRRLRDVLAPSNGHGNGHENGNGSRAVEPPNGNGHQGDPVAASHEQVLEELDWQEI